MTPREKINYKLRSKIKSIFSEKSKKWQKYEDDRKEFIKDYSIEKIDSLSEKEYAIGWGGENKSFCYRLEWGLDQLGRIRGSYSSKYGFWYGKKKGIYKRSKKFGSTNKVALGRAKIAIKELLTAVKDDEWEILYKNRFSPTVKGKILFLKYPTQFLPIYSERYLRIILNELKIESISKRGLDMQYTLYSYMNRYFKNYVIKEYKKSYPEIENHYMYLWADVLYEQYKKLLTKKD